MHIRECSRCDLQFVRMVEVEAGHLSLTHAFIRGITAAVKEHKLHDTTCLGETGEQPLLTICEIRPLHRCTSSTDRPSGSRTTARRPHSDSFTSLTISMSADRRVSTVAT